MDTSIKTISVVSPRYSIGQAIREYAILPVEAFFLGIVVEDNKPYLLNVKDDSVSNILIKSSTFNFPSLARFSAETNGVTNIRHLSENRQSGELYHETLWAIGRWMQKQMSEPLVVFVDDFDESLTYDSDKTDLLYLLSRGNGRYKHLPIKVILRCNTELGHSWKRYFECVIREEAESKTYMFADTADGERYHFYVPE